MHRSDKRFKGLGKKMRSLLAPGLGLALLIAFVPFSLARQGEYWVDVSDVKVEKSGELGNISIHDRELCKIIVKTGADSYIWA